MPPVAKNAKPPIFQAGVAIGRGADLLIVSESVRSKLRKGHYIDMWHFTDDGCRSAANARLANESVLRLNDDGEL